MHAVQGISACFVIIGLLFAFVPSTNAADEPKRVLTLSEFRPDTPTSLGRDRVVRAVLNDAFPGQVDHYNEYIDGALLAEQRDRLALRDFLRHKYADTRFDVVVTIGRAALEFTRAYGLEVFPGASVVASSTEQSIIEGARSGPLPLTGIARRMDIKGTIDLARALQPDLRSVVVIGGGLDAGYFEAMTRRQLAAEHGITVTYLIDRTMDEWLSRVTALPPRSAVLYLAVHEDGNKRRFVATDALAQLSKASSAPVYGVLAHFIGHGIVGGSVLNTDALAREIAGLTQRVLQGESARDIPLTETQAVSMQVSWPEMRRWGLSERMLPAGAVLLHKEPSILERYQWPIVAAFSVVGIQALTIAGLVIQRRRRRESEERTLAILRAVPDAMFLQTQEGVYIDYHAYDPATLVFQPETFLGRHMRDVLPERLVPPLKEALDEALRRAPEPVTVEYWLEVPGGMRHFEKRIVRCSGNRLLSIVRDTTKRKHAEQALRESQERYAIATTAGSVGVWEWNPATDAFFVDSSLAALGLGLHGEITRIDDWFARIHPDDRDRVVARLRGHVATDSPPYEDEHRMLDGAGRVRWCLTRGSVVKHSNGQVTRMTGTCTDITARKQAQEALHRAHAELARLHRITTLSEVTAALAHEINQPLTAILSNATTCLRWLGKPSPDLVEMREALQDVARDARRTNEIIGHTRRLFARQDVEKAPLDVNSLVREACTLAHERLQSARVRIRTSLARDLPAVQGNRVELQQAIWNLIVNAIDAMREATSRRVTIETSFDGQAVKVSVHDTGCGIDDNHRDRVFDPFYTTKPTGMGMGLSISRSIVEAHRGRLWIEQNGTPGATFCFTLPVPAAVDRARAIAPAVAAPAREEISQGA